MASVDAPMKSPSTHVPRKQAERRQETIAQLMDATIACLIKLGYTRTTTQAIASEAGLSQGAIFRHFQSRQDVLIAAAQVLSDRLQQAFEARLVEVTASSATQAEVVRHALRTMGEVISSPEQMAWFELQLAARTDQALCDAFRPIFARNQHSNIELAKRLLPDLIDGLPMASEIVQLLIHVFHGVRMDAHVDQDPTRQAQMVATLDLFATLLLAERKANGV